MARIIFDDRKNKSIIEGTKGDLLATVTMILNTFHKEGIATDDEIKEICRVALLSDEEVEKEASQNMNKLKGLSEKLDKIIEEFMKEV